MFKKITVSAVAVVVLTAATLAHAETVEARVPVLVNVDATVSIQPTDGTAGTGDSKNVTGGKWDTLIVTFDAVFVSYMPRGRAATAAFARYNNGTVSVRLDPRQYGSASLTLYSVGGKRVLSGKAAASAGTSNISRHNAAPGVYILSVKGDDGNSYSTRLTHSGGRLNINAAFGGGDVRTLSKEARAASGGEWTLTAAAEGYVTQTRQIDIAAGVNTAQEFTLAADTTSQSCDGFVEGTKREHFGREKAQFCDERNGKKYVYLTIGSRVWMAENLNYAGADGDIGVCYNNSADSCAKYGRLYRWVEVMNIDAVYETTFWGRNDFSKHQGICPAGWHVPRNADWSALISTVGGSNWAGNKLKTQTGWDVWRECNQSSTDEYGFSARPGGYGVPFSRGGGYGLWWSAEEWRDEQASYEIMGCDGGAVVRGNGDKDIAGSVRCVRD